MLRDGLQWKDKRSIGASPLHRVTVQFTANSSRGITVYIGMQLFQSEVHLCRPSPMHAGHFMEKSLMAGNARGSQRLN